jgi:hypothetical protein
MKLQFSRCFAWLIGGFKSPFAHRERFYELQA